MWVVGLVGRSGSRDGGRWFFELCWLFLRVGIVGFRSDRFFFVILLLFNYLGRFFFVLFFIIVVGYLIRRLFCVKSLEVCRG